MPLRVSEALGTEELRAYGLALNRGGDGERCSKTKKLRMLVIKKSYHRKKMGVVLKFVQRLTVKN